MPESIKEKSSDSLKFTLSKICESTHFPYGEIWIPNYENDFLELSPNYYVAPGNNRDDLDFFHECSQDFILSKGEGLPGRVWLNKKPEWILDASDESEGYFLRNQIAGVYGIKTGFAIPLFMEAKISMIMAFFTCDILPYSARDLALAIRSVES